MNILINSFLKSSKKFRNFENKCTLFLGPLFKIKNLKKTFAKENDVNYSIINVMCKTNFFKNVNYLQNIFLVTLIKIKIIRRNLMESQILRLEVAMVATSPNNRF